MANGPRNGKKRKLEVLALIQYNNQLRNAFIAEKLGIGEPQVGRIIKAAEEDGTIIGNKAIINPEKMGLISVSFIQFELKDSTEIPREETIKHIMNWNNVQEIHNIDGKFDLLVKVRFSANTNKIKFLDYVSRQGNVAATEGISVIDTVKETLDVCIEDADVQLSPRIIPEAS